MNSETFRAWLAEQGCRIEGREMEGRGHGATVVNVFREGRTAELPLGGSHKPLDQETVREICQALDLDWSKLPGPSRRV